MPLSLRHRPRDLPTELLDQLPPQHPDALSSRRDLRWFNAALGNARWFEKMLPPRVHPGERVLEIGAGTGELGGRLARRGVLWDGLDRVPRPSNWPSHAHWHQTDLFQFSGWADYPVVTGNLIFHHFDPAQLAILGAALSLNTRLLIIGDLRRGRLQQWLFWAYACLIGANRVSRHDGWVSIRAGFRGNELPRLLGLDDTKWTWRVELSALTAYRLIAERRA